MKIARYCFGLMLAFAAAASSAEPMRHAGEIQVENGTAIATDGSTMAYEIGTLFVPENRDKPGSRLIGVGFARVKAAHPTGAPPVVLLAGGPGVTMLDIILDHDETAKRRVKVWQAYAEVADLVVIEQRGFTLRGDRMELETKPLPLDRPMTIADDVAIVRDLARRAAAANPGKDLSGYTIVQAAHDVDDLRKALGYDRISLVAASFGSQWAFAVMKAHPGLVARAVMSSIEPLDYGYDMPSTVFAAIQRIAVEADRDPGLTPWLPKGGLIAAIRATRDRFARGPVTVTVKDAAGTTRRVVMGLEDYQLALITYSADAATFPRFILSAWHGHYDDWARDEIDWRKPEKRAVINPLINIGLGMSAARQSLLWSDPALPLLGSWNFASYLATQGEWATPDAGDAFRAPMPDPTPILFVQGDWDTSTPIDNMLAMLPYFPNARAILLHRAQHNGTFALLRSRPEVAARVYDFLRSGRTEGLPTDVALDPVVFARPDFPAPARRRGG
ncbi:MAG: alpha/beta hydrolase [Sphingomonas sp.]|jgi:pimeloyl-ACP methyl ester carboxylesterase|uniref:alpha/beta hydrolase n=1 Tax=Sphingomonas sp. TaxID=28214 RepID=UPI003569AE44